MAKIVIIGAGSGFGSRLSIDILARESLAGSTIALCDIHEGRLAQVRDYVQRAIDAHDLPGTVVAGTDRQELLPDADCVVTAVSIGGAAYWGEPYRSEVEIPLSYGVVQTVADTVGVGGVFRFLRTAPEHLQFARDMERLCPDALMLNYTNPMCMLTWLHSVGSSIRNVGLCHSVQGTTRKLAGALGVDYDRVSYLVAGINHQAWVLRLRHGREDLYPRLRDGARHARGIRRRPGARRDDAPVRLLRDRKHAAQLRILAVFQPHPGAARPLRRRQPRPHPDGEHAGA